VQETIINQDSIEINTDSEGGDRTAYIDFHGDNFYEDYSFRIQRESAGQNAKTRLIHRGTGDLRIEATDPNAELQFLVNNDNGFKVDFNGDIDGATLKNYGERAWDLGSVSGTTNINLASGNVVFVIITGATTFTFTTTHVATSFTLAAQNIGLNVTWPGNVLWEGGVLPTFSVTGLDIVTFIKLDTFWIGALSVKGAA